MSNTAIYRQNILSKLTNNGTKNISATKLREALYSGADSIDVVSDTVDEIFETLSLADSLGNYNASTNSATLKEAGTTFTPTTTANQSNGKYFNVVVAGTQSITGTSVAMAVGGLLISRGTKWDYIPPVDTGYSKAMEAKNTADNIKSYVDSEIGPVANTTYINSGTISSCTTVGSTQGITRCLSENLKAGTLTRLDFWCVRAGEIKFLILSKIEGSTYKVLDTLTHTAVLGLNTLFPNKYTTQDSLLAWFNALGTESGIVGSKTSSGAAYLAYVGDMTLGSTYTLVGGTNNVFGVSCVVTTGDLTNRVEQLEQFQEEIEEELIENILTFSPVSDLSTCTTASTAGVTRVHPTAMPQGELVQVDFWATTGGILTFFILSKNVGGTFNVVFSKDVTLSVGLNHISLAEHEAVGEENYFGWHHTSGQAVLGYKSQSGASYYAYTGKASGSNITFVTGSNFVFGAKAYIRTGLKISYDVQYLLDTVAEMEGGSVFAERPANGIVNFQVPVNCDLADVTTQGTAPQDSITEHLDWGILQLPTNYTRSGKPTRLIIGCHGTGAWIRENTTSQTASAFWLSQGYALMDMNGIPASFDNDDWDSENPDYSDNGNRHYGAPFALQSYIKGYRYVVKNYNIATDGCFVYGVSMGGLSSNMLVQSGSIPVIAQAGFSACLDLFKEAYVDPWNSGTVQRAKIAQYFGFAGSAPTFTNTKPATQPEIDYFIANINKVMGYNPMTKNVPGVGIGVATGIYKTVPSNTTSDQPTEALDYDPFSKIHPVPVKFWHNLGDSTVKHRYAKYMVNMIKRGGGIAELRTFSTGNHQAWLYGDLVEVETIDDDTIEIEASMYECFLWFKRFEL